MNILLCYKNFSKDCNVSHIGLGVTAGYCAKTLIKNGYRAQALPIFGADDLSQFILDHQKKDHPITHVVIMAQWIPAKNMALMARKFTGVKFASTCHSNIAFLEAEPPATNLIRDYIDLETGLPNFHAAANNQRTVNALEAMYRRPITYLPNIYYIHGEEPIHRPIWPGGLLRIGAFGSHRPYKNFSTCIAAAVELTQSLKAHSEIWINSGRSDGAGNAVLRSAIALTRNLPNIELKQLHWASWPEFKRFIGTMHIHLQVSHTETFNNVVADGICEGTPSVVSEAIEWCPDSWKAEPDDSSGVATVARHLLLDPHAARDGYRSLKTYVKNGLPHWKEFLGC